MNTPADYADLLTEQTGREHGVTLSKRFARVYRVDPTSRSAVAFVELSTGMIHRAESWKRPGASSGSTVRDVILRATAHLRAL